MKPVLFGLLVVLAFLAAAGVIIGVTMVWFALCNWLYGINKYLAAALTPMAFGLYFFLAFLFLAGSEAAKK